MERKGRERKGNVRKGRESERKKTDKGSSTRRLHLAPYLGSELEPPCANEGASTLCPTCQANPLQNP